MSKQKIFIGDRFNTRRSGMCEVIYYDNCNKIKVRFDNSGFEVWVRSGNLVLGNIFDKLANNNGGVGRIGLGHYSLSKDGKDSEEYRKWYNMIHRCYVDNRVTTYANCSVCEEWLNFQTFAKWMQSQTYELGWHLDKDLLVSHNKIYSPDTCCFLPSEVNNLIVVKKKRGNALPTGVNKVGNKYRATIRIGMNNKHLGYFKNIEDAYKAYSVEKINHIKCVAEKWKGVISNKAYLALLDYPLTDIILTK